MTAPSIVRARREPQVAIEHEHMPAHAAGQLQNAIEQSQVADDFAARGHARIAIQAHGARAVVQARVPLR